MSYDGDIDYYQTLFLSQNESNSIKIKESYSSLIKIFHPDKKGISEISQRLTQAYQILSNPVLKYVYDNLGKGGTEIVKSSDKLSLKARKVFDSIALNPLNSNLVQTYKAHLMNKIKQKLSQAHNTTLHSSDLSQSNIIYSPYNNHTSITVQHNLSKYTDFGFHYDPKKKQRSYFFKYLLSFFSISSESLYVINSKANSKTKKNRQKKTKAKSSAWSKSIHQTLRYKQAFASSLISFSNDELSFSNSTFGFNISSFLLAFNRKNGVVFSGSHVLSQNKKLNYSLCLLNPHYSIQTSDSHKKFNETKELSFNSEGLSLSNEVYNKRNHILMSSSLVLGKSSSSLFNLSLGIKTNSFSLIVPLIVYEHFDWVSCLLLALPYLYSRYIQRKSLKMIYTIYDRISKNNHDAFIERNRESLVRLGDKDENEDLVIGLALVGQSHLIRTFLNKRSDVLGVYDVTIALSLKVNRLNDFVIGRDIFEFEGVYIPQYAYRNEMWYYVEYKKNGLEKVVFLPNNIEDVELA